MPSILWVSADPGAGKFVFAKHLIDNVLPQASKDTVICYFFFNDDFEKQKSAKIALSCILHQLFTIDNGFLSDQVLTRYHVGGGYEKMSLHDLWDVLTTAVADSPERPQQPRNVMCIIDAFDECSQGQSQLVDILCHHFGWASIKGRANLKILITSRPYDSIRKALQPLHDIPSLKMVRLSGENEAVVSHIEDEIRVFVSSKVQHIAKLQMLTSDEETNLLNGILRFPNRTYLWIHLILDFVRHNFDEDMELSSVTAHLPPDVDAAYERMLSRSENPAKTRRLLHIIIGAAKPLTLEEMNVALAIELQHKTYDERRLVPETRFLEYLRNLCGFFVTIENNRTYLLHQTAREFLVSETPVATTVLESAPCPLPWKSSIRLTESNRILSQISIRQLQLAPDPILVTYSTRHILNFTIYSAHHWLEHYKASKDEMDHEAALSIVRPEGVNTFQNPWWFRSFHKFHDPSIFADPNLFSSTRFTSLIMSSYLDLWRVVTMLMAEKLVNANIKDTYYQRTAFAWASANGSAEVVKVLLNYCERKDLSKTQNLGSTTVDLNPMDKKGKYTASLGVKKGTH